MYGSFYWCLLLSYSLQVSVDVPTPCSFSLTKSQRQQWWDHPPTLPCGALLLLKQPELETDDAEITHAHLCRNTDFSCRRSRWQHLDYVHWEVTDFLSEILACCRKAVFPPHSKHKFYSAYLLLHERRALKQCMSARGSICHKVVTWTGSARRSSVWGSGGL